MTTEYETILLERLVSLSENDRAIYFRSQVAPPLPPTWPKCDCGDRHGSVWLLDFCLRVLWLDGVRLWCETHRIFLYSEQTKAHLINWLWIFPIQNEAAIAIARLLFHAETGVFHRLTLPISMLKLWIKPEVCTVYRGLWQQGTTADVLEKTKLAGMYNEAFARASIFFCLDHWPPAVLAFGDLRQYSNIDDAMVREYLYDTLASRTPVDSVVHACLYVGINDDHVLEQLMKFNSVTFLLRWFQNTLPILTPEQTRHALRNRWSGCIQQLVVRHHFTVVDLILVQAKIDFARDCPEYGRMLLTLPFERMSRDQVATVRVLIEHGAADVPYGDVYTELFDRFVNEPWQPAVEIYGPEVVKTHATELLGLVFATCMQPSNMQPVWRYFSSLQMIKLRFVLVSIFTSVEDRPLLRQLYSAILDDAVRTMPNCKLPTSIDDPRFITDVLAHDVLETKHDKKERTVNALAAIRVKFFEPLRSGVAKRMWLNFWRARLFQIALGLHSLGLPRLELLTIADECAPPAVRRYLPLFVKDRVFETLARFRSSEDGMEMGQQQKKSKLVE